MNRHITLVLAPVLLLGLGACNKDYATDTTRTTGGGVPAPPRDDNTAVNARDKQGAVTPLDQGNGSSDLETTRAIREAILADDDLSVDAKNVKIITNDGVVVLRGPVRSERERAVIELEARKAARTDRVVNQIDVENK